MYTRTIIAFLLYVLAIAGVAMAQTEPPAPQPVHEQFVYEWTDDKGVVHMTDDASKVPKKYRKNILKQPPKEAAPEQSQSDEAGPGPETSTPTDQEFEQHLRKDEWQTRFLDWKDKLRRSEQRYQSLQQRRAGLLTQWGSPAMAPPAVREEVAQIDQSLLDTQADIDEARRMIEEVLPDEARKAGVAPGQVRE